MTHHCATPLTPKLSANAGFGATINEIGQPASLAHISSSAMANPNISPPNLNDQLIACAEAGDLAGLELLLAQGANPRSGGSYALARAAADGHAKCVQLLIAVSSAKDHDSRALCWAASNGHAECVELLIPASDPKVNDSYALRSAATRGHAECVELLIPSPTPWPMSPKRLV